jgi:4-phospho-D-threonate 3-dehydrogenase / 4-phospho-D-erythronate 3-dehydrogenase
MKNIENTIIGISIGDLNGIGSEVILKTFEDNRMLEFCTPVIFANVKMLSFIKRTLNLTIPLHGIDRLDQIVHGKVNVYNLWREGFDISFGTNDENVGKYAIKSFVAATKALKEGVIDTLVTAPINKYNIQSEDFAFPGHTDYLDQELEGNALMMMVQGKLRVGLLTDHLPLSEVSEKLTADVITQKIKTINQSLIQDFGITRPKIAVLGINPHCGDGGVIGQEENKVLIPTLKKIYEKGTLVFGPFAADGFFGNNQYEKYDAIVATYHDQGLIPFKTLSFGKGVNYTAGLSQVRTSPDHGTAYEIAGKGIAEHSSFREAVYLSIDIFKSRGQHQEITANQLLVKEK